MTDEMRFYPRPEAPAIGLFGIIRLVAQDPDIRAGAGDEWLTVPFDAEIRAALDLAACDPDWGRNPDTQLDRDDLPRLAAWIDTRASRLPPRFVADLHALIGEVIAEGTTLDILVWR